ncbi:MAG: adenylate/guanylate cyclase domain-containing protein [Chloroflexota bacterium]
MHRLERIGSALARAAVRRSDDQRTATIKASLVLVTGLVVVLSPAWIGIYLVLGRPLSAAIPGAYALFALASLGYMLRTGRYGSVLASQKLTMFVLPMLLQWTLGGFGQGSAVMLWSFIAVLLVLIADGYRAAWVWFAALVVALVVSALLEPLLLRTVAPLPEPVRIGFFVINVAGPLFTAMVALVYFLRQRDAATARSEELLLNVLPASVADRLKRGSSMVADRHEAASVLFADIVSFTAFAEQTAPERVVELLGRVFETLDDLTARHGLEKIKTLGDGYMAVAGVPQPRADHARAAAAMAVEIEPALRAELGADWPSLHVRVGIASGPLVAGVIGSRRFSYDLWGDTVNTAARMAGLAEPGSVVVADSTASLLDGAATLEARGETEVKGKGPMKVWHLKAIVGEA